jgi:hypothetical protein
VLLVLAVPQLLEQQQNWPLLPQLLRAQQLFDYHLLLLMQVQLATR